MRIGVLGLVIGLSTGASLSAPSGGNSASRPALDLRALLADPLSAVRGRDRLDNMRDVLAAAQTPLEQASIELAMANWLLAVPTASPATRWLMGLPAGDDLEIIHETARDAQGHLARARKLLGAEEAEPRERWRELRSAASVLEAFARLLFACAADRDSQGYRDGCESAAAGLAAARESEKQAVAAAAMMWQAQAFALAQRSERSLSTLPDALARPERLPYDFMSRLLRCRILADSGDTAAAIALTMRIRGMCDDWFPQLDNETVFSRARLVGVLQGKLTQDWLAKPGTSPQAARPLQATLDALREAVFPPGRPNPVYHLDTAVPIIVEAPPLRAPQPAPPPEEPREPSKPSPDEPSSLPAATQDGPDAPP